RRLFPGSIGITLRLSDRPVHRRYTASTKLQRGDTVTQPDVVLSDDEQGRCLCVVVPLKVVIDEVTIEDAHGDPTPVLRLPSVQDLLSDADTDPRPHRQPSAAGSRQEPKDTRERCLA